MKTLFSVLLFVFFNLSASAASVVVVPLGGDSYRAAVPKTGQTTCYTTAGDLIDCSTPGPHNGADGDIQAGVPWPDPRFIDLGNGTVRDAMTDLIWLQNANCSDGLSDDSDGKMNFPDALGFVDALNAHMLLSDCGDTDQHDDWRLPNRFELESLLDLSQGESAVPDDLPALPAGHPFLNVEVDDYYWSSSYHSYFKGLGIGWAVNFSAGHVDARSWTLHSPPDSFALTYVWPVRAGTN